MYRLTILYAPGDEEHRAPAEELAARFSQPDLETVVKAARDAQIPDVTASDLVVFGSAVAAGGGLHPDFAEMIRAFEGINLAGRLSAFLAYQESGGKDGAPALFRRALGETEIAVFPEVLNLPDSSSDAPSAGMASWADRLYTTFKDGLHE